VIWLPIISSAAEDVPLSEETEACILCHESINSGIIHDWKNSRHAQITPAAALQKPALERRISNEAIPPELASTAVGCYECHSLNTADHADSFEHFGYEINIIVSPKDCQTCHLEEATQYANSKKAHAIANLRENPLYHTLVQTTLGVQSYDETGWTHAAASGTTENETCFACHGSEVMVLGMRDVETDFGEITVPHLANWPNQGVGRKNPDGSLGACTSCHPRHSFSIEIARKPYTCSECHLQPDVPAWDVYQESKHGNIFFSQQDQWNWTHVPWRVGQDFQSPTCATCHNSLLTDPSGETVIAERTHDFGARLWVRLFGLIYSHPQPKTGNTTHIRNKDGLPLPTAFDGEIAAEYLLTPEEQTERKNTMKRVCQPCHGPSWTLGHFAQMDSTLAETDQMVYAATQLMQQAWDTGLADPENPFDEHLEKKWVELWLFYANSIRYASAMCGQDYATFKNGWWQLNQNLEYLKTVIQNDSK